MKNKHKQGFTLVEIMIVVVIIGLLAGMAIPAFQRVRNTSQQKAALNNLRQITSVAQQIALETNNPIVPWSIIRANCKNLTDIGEAYKFSKGGVTAGPPAGGINLDDGTRPFLVINSNGIEQTNAQGLLTYALEDSNSQKPTIVTDPDGTPNNGDETYAFNPAWIPTWKTGNIGVAL